jgi:type IV pilus assembly protein PilW
MVLQAGFQDVLYASTKDNSAPEPAPDLMGVDNAIPVFADPLGQFTRRAAGAGGYGSDVLIVRFQTPQTFPGSGVVDKSLRDCWGNPGAAVAQSRYDRVVNILYVDNSTGDLSLMCRSGTYTYTQGVLAADFSGPAQPVVQGVENFQVLYGTDGVSPHVATPGVADQVIERYLRADQINGEAAWRRVRSLRIGLVLRGPPKSAPASAATTLYPLGQAYSASDDPGAVLTPSLDGRLRQVLAHTIYLRNLAP